MLEDCLVPSTPILKQLTSEKSNFEYLLYLSDIQDFFKTDTYTISELKQELTSKALINLYLSSLTDLSSTYNLDMVDDFDRLSQAPTTR